MATYDQIIASGFLATGDDPYGKPVVGSDVVQSPWGDDALAAIEVGTTNQYKVTPDRAKAYVFFRNGSSNAFTANATTNVINCTAHGLLDGETVRFKGADLPAPLAQSTIYYVVNKTDDTFQVETTPSGGAVDLTDVGSGVMVFVAPSQRSSTDQVIGSASAIVASELTGEGESGISSAVVLQMTNDVTWTITREAAIAAAAKATIAAEEVVKIQRAAAPVTAGAAIADGYTFEEALRLLLAVLVGKVAATPTSAVFRSADDAKARVTATVDASGNRTVVNTDAT